MSRNTIPISGFYPAPYRPHDLSLGGRWAGQDLRQPTSAASVTLAAPEPPGTIIEGDGDVRILCSAPTAVIFTLNQDRE